MAFYDDMAATAAAILAEFGQTVTLTRRTAGTYSTTTGLSTVTETTQTASGAVFDWDNRAVDGTRILAGDRRLLISAVGVTAPVPGDNVTVGAAVYTIKDVKPLNPGGTAVMYECNVRGGA